MEPNKGKAGSKPGTPAPVTVKKDEPAATDKATAATATIDKELMPVIVLTVFIDLTTTIQPIATLRDITIENPDQLANAEPGLLTGGGIAHEVRVVELGPNYYRSTHARTDEETTGGKADDYVAIHGDGTPTVDDSHLQGTPEDLEAAIGGVGLPFEAAAKEGGLKLSAESRFADSAKPGPKKDEDAPKVDGE